MNIPPLGVAVAIAPLIGFAVELLWLSRGAPWYDSVTLPLPFTPLPIPTQPEDEGRTSSVAWQRLGDTEFRWFVDLKSHDGVTGLHGTVRLQRVRGGWGLGTRWFPPWSALLTILIVMAYGMYFGLARMVVPLSVVMTLGVFAVYYEGAMRAAASLRYAFVQGSDEEDPQ